MFQVVTSSTISTYTGGNRAEKYLPFLPIIQHGEMGKSLKLENSRFLEVISIALVSRMEAVCVRDECLKLRSFCGH